MALAIELGERYRELFRSYGTGGDPQVIGVKRRIAEQENNLREDAMYFLLVNLDHMVIRAISGYVPSRDAALAADPMPPFKPPQEAAEMAHRALGILLEDLARRRAAKSTKSSANDVVRALEATAEAIGNAVAWWR